ncbi:MAG: glycosyltransferase family 2 protein [Flammeovirgaceae bacterium]
MIQITILIPFLNESANIPFLVQSLGEFCKRNNNLNFEVIFIDDGSTDNSFELLQEQKHEFYTYKIIKLSKNFGSHAALRAGILHAQGEYITFMYADLQDPLELVIKLYREINENRKEIVWAYRNEKQSWFSGFYAKLMKKFAVKNFPENGFDIVMFSRKVQKLLNENIEANSSIFLQILTLGFPQSSITYQKQPRKAGKSKWTLAKKIKLMIDSFVAFSFFPIRLVSVVGILLFVVGTLFALYLITRKLIFDDIKEGWTALASILMIGFGITNISLGIIAEYLWRTLDASRKRPVFIIDEIIEN